MSERVLPADVYDALELSALAHGGIGSGHWIVRIDGGEYAPYCAMGHADFLEDSVNGEVHHAMTDAGIWEKTNDEAVAVVNARLNRLWGRVPFDEWCKELGVVRGS